MSEPRYPYVHVDVTPEMVDEMSATLFELGAQGVEERDEGTLAKNASAGKVTLVAAFETKADADEAIAAIAEMGALDPALSPRYEEIVGDAWRDAWKEHYRPFAIAPGVIIRPPWEPYEAKPGEHVLELEPGRAFGTGLHETTKLVARALANHRAVLVGKTVLDVGCGSGVLALIALCLGAAKAVATDIDPEAIDVTKENCERNKLSSQVEATTKPLQALDTIAPVVVANIEARVLIPMAPELMKHVEPGGLLFLSGILVPQTEDVRAAYISSEGGMETVSTETMGEWTMLALRKKGA
jgi:ribosomal protein L11 methyltransferase